MKYSKFWSVSLEHFVERKPLFSEEGSININYQLLLLKFTVVVLVQFCLFFWKVKVDCFSLFWTFFSWKCIFKVSAVVIIFLNWSITILVVMICVWFRFWSFNQWSVRLVPQSVTFDIVSSGWTSPKLPGRVRVANFRVRARSG